MTGNFDSTGLSGSSKDRSSSLHKAQVHSVLLVLFIFLHLSSTSLTGGVRQRVKKEDVKRYEPDDWDPSLPYGGKVYLARRKKPDSWLCILIQVTCILLFISCCVKETV